MDLTWDKYNPAEPSIFVSAAKTPAGVRKVYLTSRANAIVRRQAHINEYIFNHTKLAPVTPTVTRRLVDRIRKASGVDTLACHVCRHPYVKPKTKKYENFFGECRRNTLQANGRPLLMPCWAWA